MFGDWLPAPIPRGTRVMISPGRGHRLTDEHVAWLTRAVGTVTIDRGEFVTVVFSHPDRMPYVARRSELRPPGGR